MVDHFKLVGVLYNYKLDQTCWERGYIYSQQRKIYQYFKIPNRKRTDDITISYPVDSPNEVWIEGNLRKWWSNSRLVLQDLNCDDIYDALEFLAQRLSVDVFDLLNLSFANVEIGANIVLPIGAEIIIPSMIDYPQLKRVPYGIETTYFIGSKYHIKAYDKLKEIEKHSKSAKIKRLARKLRKVKFLLRFEISVDAPSGYRLKPMTNTFGDIILNYEKIVQEWYDSFTRVTLLDRTTNPIELKPEELTRKEYLEYNAYQNFEKIGIEQAIIGSDRLVKSHKAISRREILRIYKRFRSDQNSQLFDLIEFKVLKKYQELLIVH